MQIADIDFCRPEDLEALYAIETACFDIPWEKRVLENDLPNQGSVVYLKATLKDRIAGYAVLNREQGICHLLNIAVLPEFQQQGIASQLFLGLEAVAEEWGCRRMRLEVRSPNRIARDFYARIGFVYNARLKGYYANGEDALILVARLPLRIK